MHYVMVCLFLDDYQVLKSWNLKKNALGQKHEVISFPLSKASVSRVTRGKCWEVANTRLNSQGMYELARVPLLLKKRKRKISYVTCKRSFDFQTKRKSKEMSSINHFQYSPPLVLFFSLNSVANMPCKKNDKHMIFVAIKKQITWCTKQFYGWYYL